MATITTASDFSFTKPLQDSFTTLLNYIPRLIGALIVLVIGYFIAKFVGRIVTMLLRKVKFDQTMERAGVQTFLARSGTSLTPSSLLGKVVFWLVFIMTFTMFASALGVPEISGFLNSALDFIPNVFAAIAIVFLGLLLSNFLAGIVRGASGSEGFAKLTRYIMMVYVAFVALFQLHIAQALTGPTFLILLGGVALAAGLAFGLGGRDQAQAVLDRLVASRPTGAGSGAGSGADSGGGAAAGAAGGAAGGAGAAPSGGTHSSPETYDDPERRNF
ncbi:MAG TPA: mechanosensitive ion channel [Mycobacteriales bacterium]|nr:mechanosensitive ion channel [Mycobacteriales bacterium]